MPKTKVKLDVTQLENFIYDMSKCIKCKGCTWVDHINARRYLQHQVPQRHPLPV